MTKRSKILSFLDKYIVQLVAAIMIIVALIALNSCNPVKKVLQDTSKMKQVWEVGVLKSWCVNDSVYVSDTTIISDTLNVIETVSDTVQIGDSVWIDRVEYRTIHKTITIRDTTVVTDNSRVNLLQKELQNKGNEILLFHEKLTNSVNKITLIKKERNKWRLYFFVLLAAFTAFILRKPILKLISPIKF